MVAKPIYNQVQLKTKTQKSKNVTNNSFKIGIYINFFHYCKSLQLTTINVELI